MTGFGVGFLIMRERMSPGGPSGQSSNAGETERAIAEVGSPRERL